jgi:NADPH2:quinone reductase
MRAIVVPRLGGPDVLTLREIPRPVPGKGEILVRVRYAGITYGDVYQREGTYRVGKPLTDADPPLPIGAEGAGTVAELGEGVTGVASGDSVVYADTLGSYAEYVAVPAWRAIKIPSGISLRDAAAVYSQGLTAHYLAHDTGKLRKGMSCLIHAGAGGVGHILVQLAKGAGAAVAATVGSPEKAEFARSLGADKVILYREKPFLQEIKSWGDGKGVDVVYDSIGRVTIADSIKAVRMHGLCVLYGNTSGLVESVSPMDLAAAGSIFFTRPRLNHHIRTREETARRADDLFKGLKNGTLKVAISKVLPLDQAGDAHRLIESRSTAGKVLLEVAA